VTNGGRHKKERATQNGCHMSILGHVIAIALLLASLELVGCNKSVDTTWRPDDPAISPPGKF
jgi:hypothetical protein